MQEYAKRPPFDCTRPRFASATEGAVSDGRKRLSIQFRDRCAQTARFRRRVPIGRHELGSIQDFADDFALHADAFPMDNTNVGISSVVREEQILLDDGFDLLRRDRVQIDYIRQRQLNRFRKRVFILTERRLLAGRLRPGLEPRSKSIQKFHNANGSPSNQ